MRQVYTHNELEVVMTRLGWKPLVKRGAWRRFYKRADYTRAHGVASMATIARLPSRSFVDAPKHIILDFVKTVNRRENRNVLCCWWVLHPISSHSVPLPVSMHAGCRNLGTQLRPKQVYTFFCVWGLVNRFRQDWNFATESRHGKVLGNFFINANMKLWKLLSVGLRVFVSAFASCMNCSVISFLLCLGVLDWILSYRQMGVIWAGSRGDRNAYTRLGENSSVSSVLVLLFFSLSSFSELKS